MIEEIILPTESDTVLIDKLSRVFGESGAREILRLVKAILLRRISSIITWSNWYLTKMDIAGLKLRTSFYRSYTDSVFELTIKVVLEDLDPVLIKKNLRELYRMAKPDRDQARVLKELEAIVEKYYREEELEKIRGET